MGHERVSCAYYFATGIAAAITTILVSLMPFPSTAPLFNTVTIGASGAIYGLLLAYGLTFPNRPIYMYFIFADPGEVLRHDHGRDRAALVDGRHGRRHRAHHASWRAACAGFVMLRGRR